MTVFDRETRAAHNQSVFRAVNEKIREANEGVAVLADELTIACECADATCIATLSIARSEYSALRASPRRFAVLPGHVDPDVEDVVAEADGYVVVEKTGHGAEVAERIQSRD